MAALLWGGRSVKLSSLVRSSGCSAPEYPRRNFAERMASVVEPYARKTTRLHKILRLVGFALGGEGGARLLWRLGMRASLATLLRYTCGARRASYIHRRWAEGCDNAMQLWREIEALGYGGKVAMVGRYARRLRARLTGSTPEKRAAFLGNGKYLQSSFGEQLCRLCQQTDPVRDLARGFRNMVNERRPEELDAWLGAVEGSEVAELEGFAGALRRDYEAVVAALEYEWSSGQVERQFNRLKLIKRQMYGRASFDLLRQCVLGAT